MKFNNSSDCSWDREACKGRLDGVTIMRYAHIDRRRSSGGVEQYLRLVDHGLLQKHRMTVVKTHLVKDEPDVPVDVEEVGLGRIVWVAVPYAHSPSLLFRTPQQLRLLYKHALHRNGVERSRLDGALGRLRCGWRHLLSRTAIFSEGFGDLLRTANPDLLTVHWLTYDTDCLLERARVAGIPFVLINHFNNTYLLRPATRKWAPCAAGIASVASRGMPEGLQDCSDLSDAVDVDFFSPLRATRTSLLGCPVALLPARVQEGKGHTDLIAAVAMLRSRGLDVGACFAGAIESDDLYQRVRRQAAQYELNDRVVFLGDQTPEQLRDVYAASTLVVLPSSSEGLPRVLLEAQAMEKPVVTYDSGGVGDAVLAGRTGFVLERGDIGRLAERIGFLLANPAERVRMGAEGRAFMRREFGVDALIGRHERLYISVLNGTRHAS